MSHAPLEQLALERPLRRLATAVRIEDLRLDAGRFEHARKPPDTQRRSEESVFAAVRIVRTDQQYSWRSCVVHVDSTPCPHSVSAERRFAADKSELGFEYLVSGVQNLSRGEKPADTSQLKISNL